MLARHFMVRFARKYRKRVPELSTEAVRRLREYHWPGNVRELSHVMENVTLLSDSGVIRAQDLGLSSGGVVMPPIPAASGRFVFPLGDPSCTLANIERQVIEQAMQQTEGNVSEAAKLLGLSRSALRRRLENRDEPGSQLGGADSRF
jgi:DNA-binding NtrC family response regulator